MTDKTLRSRRRRLRFVIPPEVAIVKGWPDIPRVAFGRHPAAHVDVATGAIRHLKLGRNRLGSIVALHAIEHFRQRQIA